MADNQGPRADNQGLNTIWNEDESNWNGSSELSVTLYKVQRSADNDDKGWDKGGGFFLCRPFLNNIRVLDSPPHDWQKLNTAPVEILGGQANLEKYLGSS